LVVAEKRAREMRTTAERRDRSSVLEVGSDRSAARAREDYVKAIYQLDAAGPVRAADVARYLGVTPVSVHKAKLALERDGMLVVDGKTHRLALTTRGRRLAVAMVRRHRLVEAFLHDVLAVPLERVHAEAERMEHVISDDVAERLARHLQYPARDPHGHLIPYGLHDAADPPLPTLATVTSETEVRVVSIDDHDAKVVGALANDLVLPGLSATALPDTDGAVRLRCGTREIVVAGALAAKVRIATR
jgi:DtxR family Mn-dependent transcriptional regulator